MSLTSQITPAEFLIVSSPRMKKIVYTELVNFKSLAGRAYALVDSGLDDPRGIAVDPTRGNLYIADRGLGKILRYRLVVEDSGGLRSLSTDGIQLCVMQGVRVEWVDVDDTSGDLLYTDSLSMTVNRIPNDVVERLSEGQFPAGSITVVSERQQEADSLQLQQELADGVVATGPIDGAAVAPHAYSLYEGGGNPHVSSPAGIVSDGVRLYWVNQRDGLVSGTVVKGEVHPRLAPQAGGSSRPPLFATTPLVNTSSSAFGITKSGNMIYFTGNSTAGSGFIQGVTEHGTVVPFATDLIQPRGLVWDGDNTIYVADEASDLVLSLPAGVLGANAPKTMSVLVDGPFGVAIFKDSDAAWKTNRAAAAGLHGRGKEIWHLLFCALLLAAAR